MRKCREERVRDRDTKRDAVRERKEGDRQKTMQVDGKRCIHKERLRETERGTEVKMEIH